jgi:phage repressor protein C with HTH and peptisase S24 domain
MNVGERMRAIRKQKQMSADELARKIGVSRSTIFRYEKGDIEKVPIEIVAKVADALDIKPEQLMGLKPASIADSVHNIVTRLHPARQEKVYNYADNQLKEQQNENVISLDDERQERQPMLLHIAGTVSAGTGEYLPDDDTGDDIPFSGPVPDYDFALRVNGDSMEPMFEDGQIIFVKKCDDCDIHSGQIVIADLNGDAYVKKIDIQPDGVRLVSLNPKYKPILVESFDDFAIQGIVML